MGALVFPLTTVGLIAAFEKAAGTASSGNGRFRRFEKGHRLLRGESFGQNATRRTGADDDIVRHVPSAK